jgi:sulfatase modifying factor 1
VRWWWDASSRPIQRRRTRQLAERIEQLARAQFSPGFRVRLDRPYYIGKYEVTQAQWTQVMSDNPSIFRGAGAGEHPVGNVTWDAAQMFVRKLNALEKTTRYRLPSEFEWEYAARAGGEGDIPWTEIREQAITGYNAFTSTHRVGEKHPNRWGFYDMLGNVWEWVDDFYNEKIFRRPDASEDRTRTRAQRRRLRG